MAFTEQAHVNDIGTIFRVTVYDKTSTGGSSVADISTATSKTFYLRKPDGTTISRSAIFTTDGSDGKIEYATVDGDLSGAGSWELQAKIVTPDGSWNTDVGNFRVHENLY